MCDVRDKEHLPEITDVEILINNAGTQNEDDIDINLKALIYITEKYGVQSKIKSVLNIGSASGHTGAEFPEYCASKGGVLSYTKNVAMRVAQYGATCNSLDPGGVLTPLNECVMNDPELDEIVDFILHGLHSGATLNEIIGAYDNTPRKEVITIVDKHEYRKLMDFVR